MARREFQQFSGTLLDERTVFSLRELCVACGVHAEIVIEMVEEGVLEPRGADPADWVFPGSAVTRAQKALKLARDLRVNWPGAALAPRPAGGNRAAAPGAATDRASIAAGARHGSVGRLGAGSVRYRSGNRPLDLDMLASPSGQAHLAIGTHHLLQRDGEGGRAKVLDRVGAVHGLSHGTEGLAHGVLEA